MVEYVDGSVIAQLGKPDMRIPIICHYLSDRQHNHFNKLDFRFYKELTFEEPDYVNFPCLKIAFDAIKESGTMPAVMNAANSCVNLFLIIKLNLHIPW